MTSVEQIQNTLRYSLQSKNRIGYALLGLWVILMIGMPWLQFFFGDDVIPIAINIAAILQASAVFCFVQEQWGLQRTAGTFVVVGIITWGAEFIGHRTGVPFGDYQYSDALQPQIAGVPLLIPVAWFMLLPSAWVMAQIIVGERDSVLRWIAYIGFSAVALTAWDLFLDPQMVNWGFWVWENPSGYFGIPYSNYVGWLLVAAFVTIVVRPPKLKVMPLALVYGIVWFLQTVGQGFIWRQLGPAIVGCLVMGSVMLLAYWRSRASTT